MPASQLPVAAHRRPCPAPSGAAAQTAFARSKLAEQARPLHALKQLSSGYDSFLVGTVGTNAKFYCNTMISLDKSVPTTPWEQPNSQWERGNRFQPGAHAASLSSGYDSFLAGTVGTNAKNDCIYMISLNKSVPTTLWEQPNSQWERGNRLQLA